MKTFQEYQNFVQSLNRFANRLRIPMERCLPALFDFAVDVDNPKLIQSLAKIETMSRPKYKYNVQIYTSDHCYYPTVPIPFDDVIPFLQKELTEHTDLTEPEMHDIFFELVDTNRRIDVYEDEINDCNEDGRLIYQKEYKKKDILILVYEEESRTEIAVSLNEDEMFEAFLQKHPHSPLSEETVRTLIRWVNEWDIEDKTVEILYKILCQKYETIPELHKEDLS